MYQGVKPSTDLTERLRRLFKPQPRILDQLTKHPDLGWFLQFHSNGFVRQAALQRLAASPVSPFEFSAIVYRLNDWVGNVRNAALNYAKQAFPTTEPDIVAESAVFLLPQSRILKRWDRDGQHQLENAIYRPEVLMQLKERFLTIRAGRVGHTLQELLQRSDFDHHLEELAQDATLPRVRAVAIDALLMRRAKWFIGYRHEWTDKVHGLKRRTAEFGMRHIERTVDFHALLQNAAQDKSAHVRKVAGDVLIVTRGEATAEMDQIAQLLASDRNPSVRSRADFYLRRRATEG